MAEQTLYVYTTSVTSNSATRGNQHKLMDILQVQHIEFKEIDVTQLDSDGKTKLRENIGKKSGCKVQGLPPMPLVFRGDEYIGNFIEFQTAVDDERLEDFLKGAPQGEICQQQAQS